MNDSKVYHMSENMECQYLTEDAKIRLYLSPMRYEKKETITEKIAADLLALLYSAAVTDLIGQWAIEAAYKFRGYEAIGGEYILIAVTAAGTFWAVKKILRHRG